MPESKPKRRREVGLPDDFNVSHLTINEQGEIYDTHLEYLFKDLYSADSMVGDSVSLGNLRLYATMMLDGEPLPPDAFENDARAIEWAASHGLLSLGPIPDKLRAEDADVERLGLRIFARFIRGKQITKPVMGKTAGRAALLVVVQYMREIAWQHNNKDFYEELKHLLLEGSGDETRKLH